MGDLKFSLMWDAYFNNMSKGLSSLQQRGEFVDMTLAADGHFVKVHKLVMCVVSPYIKELVSSAQCTHPVIFLNQISHETLASILEYVYTGQVLISNEKLTKFMEACKALHIKGFEDLKCEDVWRCDDKRGEEEIIIKANNTDDNMHDYTLREETLDYEQTDDNDTTVVDCVKVEHDIHPIEEVVIPNIASYGKKPTVQYSLSNHGNLQLVLNRYVYNLRYSARRSGQHTWQCVDGHCKGKKCPARVTTYRDNVVERVRLHNHPQHDKKILQKVQAGILFSCLRDAEHKMNVKRYEKDNECEDEDSVL